MINISIVEMPGVETPARKCPTVEDKVRECLDVIDSGYESEVEWKMIGRLMCDLYKMQTRSPRVQNLINMIEPVMSKYGYHGIGARK